MSIGALALVPAVVVLEAVSFVAAVVFELVYSNWKDNIVNMQYCTKTRKKHIFPIWTNNFQCPAKGKLNKHSRTGQLRSIIFI